MALRRTWLLFGTCCVLLAGALARGGTPAGPPRTDRSGDPLPEGALARLGGARLRHEILTGTESRFAFSPDGRTLASSNYQTIRLWDCRTGKRLREIRLEPEEYLIE